MDPMPNHYNACTRMRGQVGLRVVHVDVLLLSNAWLCLYSVCACAEVALLL